MAVLLLGEWAEAERVQVDLEVAPEWSPALDTARPRPIGFDGVPAGPHRLSALTPGGWRHRWVSVSGAESSPGVRLAPFPCTERARWEAITVHLRCGGAILDDRPHAAGAARAGSTELDRLLRATGGPGGLLAATELTFIEGFFTPDVGDLTAIARWYHLLGVLASAGPADLAAWPHLFPGAVETLGRQIALIGVDLLDDPLVYALDFLAAELLRSPDPDLALCGLTLGQLLGG